MRDLAEVAFRACRSFHAKALVQTDAQQQEASTDAVPIISCQAVEASLAGERQSEAPPSPGQTPARGAERCTIDRHILDGSQE
jgi:hypothetical protein